MKIVKTLNNAAIQKSLECYIKRALALRIPVSELSSRALNVILDSSGITRWNFATAANNNICKISPVDLILCGKRCGWEQDGDITFTYYTDMPIEHAKYVKQIRQAIAGRALDGIPSGSLYIREIAEVYWKIGSNIRGIYIQELVYNNYNFAIPLKLSELKNRF